MYILSLFLRFFVCISFFLTVACTGGELAPVVESSWMGHSTAPVFYLVKKGDTLYSIAFRYDLDYRQLAAMNALAAPYRLQVGQRLQMRMNQNRFPAHPINSVKNTIKVTQQIQASEAHHQFMSPPAQITSVQKTSNLPHSVWSWPVQGKLISQFSPQNGKKGINIAGHKGAKISAAKNGIVAYAGSGLNGYGNLIIIKHDDHFLTAYGNNARNFVHEGQVVRAGQTIAQMGMIDGHDWGVHFEIRRNGQPINPLHVLPR